MDEGNEQEPANWSYVPDAGAPEGTDFGVDEAPSVTWSASEYISSPKNAAWYGLLALGAGALSLIIYLLTKDKMSLFLIVALAVIFGVFAARKPRVLQYRIDGQGLLIASKLYPYEVFKSFSIVEAGPFNYISLLPLRRFMPPLSIHYSPEDEERIIMTLADYLPYEEHKRDLVENLSRRIRF